MTNPTLLDTLKSEAQEEFETRYKSELDGARNGTPYFFGIENFKSFLDTLITTTAKRVAEAFLLNEIKSLNEMGEIAPTENSPEIYGNERVKAFKNGFNACRADMLQRARELGL
jgi:hypothetical protein